LDHAISGVFKDGGMKDYLEHVRSSGRYSSRFIESHFEWRQDVRDGIEVSTYHSPNLSGIPAGATHTSDPTAVSVLDAE
jgi:hypothetical protein